MPLLPEFALGGLRRSDVLRPMTWLTGLLLLATVSSSFEHEVPWLTVALAVATGVSSVVYVGAYIYCLLKDPNNLRSENFLIQQKALDKGLYGDSDTGIIDGVAESISEIAGGVAKKIGTDQES